MGLEKVKQEIIAKVESEASAIIGEARQEEDKILQEARSRADEYRRKAEEDTDKIIEGLEKREIAAAVFNVKKMKLDKKKEIVDLVFKEVADRIEKMDSKKRAEFIKKLADKTKKEIDVRYIRANRKDKPAVESIRGVSYIESGMLGGIIAENASRDISVDYSFEEILREIREKSLQEIAKILF